MIEKIDAKIQILVKFKDSKEVMKDPKLRAMVCTVIEKAYFLESIILLKRKIIEQQDDQFFTATSAVNRYFRDSGLDEVADIYNELCLIAGPHL